MKTTQFSRNHLNLFLNLKFKCYTIVSTVFLFVVISVNILIAQTDVCANFVPFSSCRDYEYPDFIGGETLCETYSSFTPYYTIANGTYASDLTYTVWPENVTVFTNKNILIQGIFYVNSPVAFWNCVVKMAPGAQIIVAASAPKKTEIFIYKTKFFSCDVMWKGIILGQNVRARILNSVFEDAQFTLTVKSGVSLSIFRSVFNRNFVAITNYSGNATLPFMYFGNNTIECTSILNDYYDLNYDLDNYPASYAGILLNHCSSSIGFFNSNNTFKYMCYGIVANYSTVSIRGCKFENTFSSNFIIPNAFFYQREGAAIQCLTSNIFINGDEHNQSASFKNTIILSKGSNFSISFANFENSDLFCADNLNGETIKIEDNEFDGGLGPLASLIQVNRSASSGEQIHTYIRRNNLSYISSMENTTKNFIISLSCVGDPTDVAVINNNVIETNVCHIAGINLYPSASKNNLIFNNDITIDATKENSIGIDASYGSLLDNSSIISNNHIVSDSYSQTSASYGIYSWRGIGMTYCEDTVNNEFVGLCFVGNCNGTKIIQNNIGNHAVGLLVRDVNKFHGEKGVLGYQYGPRNTWLENVNVNYLLFPALYSSSEDILLSTYFLHPDDHGVAKYDPANVSPSGWFIPKNVTRDLCGEVTKASLTKFDSLIIDSDPAFEELSEPEKFYLELTLITEIIGNSSLSSDFEYYLSTKEDDSEYIIAETIFSIKNALQMDSEIQNSLDSLLEVQNHNLLGLRIIDSTNYKNIDTITFSDGIKLDTINNILNRVYNKFSLMDTIKNDRMSNLISDLTDINEDLSSLITRGQFDEDYKTIYSLFMKEIIYGGLDSTDLESINSIAFNDLDSSFANYTALIMFDPCSQNNYIDYIGMDDFLDEYFEILEEFKIPDVKNEITQDNMKIELVDGGISIELGKTPIKYLLFYLYDMSGKLVDLKVIDGKHINIPYEKFPAGLYYWIISNPAEREPYKSGILPIY